MTEIRPVQKSLFPASAETLDDIGAEFGCERGQGEEDDSYCDRLTACLDCMIEELQQTQDRVQELVA